MAPDSRPSAVEKAGPRTLRVVWSDGLKSDVDVVELRRRCPCAHCVDEFTRQPLLKPEDVSDTVRPVRVRSLGRYALSVDFTDGHSSSIFSWELLRGMMAK